MTLNLKAAEMEKISSRHLMFSLYLLFFLSLNTFTAYTATAQNQTVPINVDVGVVLNMDNSFGKMGLSCISMALSNLFASNSHYRTKLVLHTRNAKEDDVGAAAALLKNVEVKAIIGPPYSMQANFLIDLGDKAQVPIISFSATSPSVSSTRSPYFIRITQKDSSQVNAISGWREVVPIYVDNEFGEGIIPFLTDALENVNARVPYSYGSVIPSMATDDQIVAELYKLMTMQTRVFIVRMMTRLFTKAKQLGMMSEGYAWIITDGITNEINSIDTCVTESMLGVIGVKPYIPFATPDHKSAGSYNDLVYQVYLGNYDVAVGDITIVANGSLYVDFTLPYTESGVSMIVPIKDSKGKLSWELWLTSFRSFVFIGFLIWLLQHRINEDFRGPPLHQVGMIFCFAFSTMVFAHALETTIPVNVGVLLDMNTTTGKMSLQCIKTAISDFYETHGYYKTRLSLHARDSKGNGVDAALAALDLVNNVKVQAIIGPQESSQAYFVIILGNNSNVPIILFSATSPSLTSLRSSYFVRATLNDSSQVEAITSLVKAFNWREVVPIYVDDEFGMGIFPYLTDSLKQMGVRVPYRSAIHPFASDEEILKELQKLTKISTKVFIIHMLPTLGARLLAKIEEAGMMSKGYGWIITDGITNLLSSMDPSAMYTMQGVVGVKPHVPETKRLKDFTIRWGSEHHELNIFGLWAYDAATALARAIELVHSRNATLLGENLSLVLSNISFRGLSGEFQIVNGQLQPSAFEIINVMDKRERVVGFWTQEDGFLRSLHLKNMSKYNISSDKLKAIIWPGESTSVPTSGGKKMRILVPTSSTTFPEFIQVTNDRSNNTTIVKGYCKDVFDEVMKQIPYAIPYDFIPFQKSNGESAGSYNDLIDQVHQENYDAVVGDVTILAKRSLYVDFSLPYTESGVRLLVPLTKKKENAWVFLRPLTWQLWLASAFCLLWFGLVILILESRERAGPRRVNRFWRAFTHIFPHNKEEVVSNLTKFVVIIWCCVVLILTQSYTASLSSMLTVQQLVPSITDIQELAKSGSSVAYQKDSFILELLEELNFSKSQLKIYRSTDDLNAALQNGSVAGVFDEIPYLTLFMKKYCSKYIMVDETYKTDGFGFVFPLGSSLVSDVSRGILQVMEGEKRRSVENKWFGPKNCADSTSSTSRSENLGLSSFWGLFVVAWISTVLALIIFLGLFLYERRNSLVNYLLNRPIEVVDADNNNNIMRPNPFASLVLLQAIIIYVCNHPLNGVFNRRH